jgi:hypothetical protein
MSLLRVVGGKQGPRWAPPDSFFWLGRGWDKGIYDVNNRGDDFGPQDAKCRRKIVNLKVPSIAKTLRKSKVFRKRSDFGERGIRERDMMNRAVRCENEGVASILTNIDNDYGPIRGSWPKLRRGKGAKEVFKTRNRRIRRTSFSQSIARPC